MSNPSKNPLLEIVEIWVRLSTFFRRFLFSENTLLKHVCILYKLERMSIFYIHKAALNPTQNLYTMSMYILGRLLRPRAQLAASSAHSVVRGAPNGDGLETQGFPEGGRWGGVAPVSPQTPRARASISDVRGMYIYIYCTCL